MQPCNSRRVAPGDVAQPVSRQPDVTGHHGTELPEHPLGASLRVADGTPTGRRVVQSPQNDGSRSIKDVMLALYGR